MTNPTRQLGPAPLLFGMVAAMVLIVIVLAGRSGDIPEADMAPDPVFVATQRDVRWGDAGSTVFATDCLNVDRWDGTRWRQFIAAKSHATDGWEPADEAAAARAALEDEHPQLDGCNLGGSLGFGMEMPTTAEPGIYRWCGLDYQDCYVFEYLWAGYQAEYGGDAAVYRRIAGLADCGELQAEFDAAESAGYRVAADDRMDEICDRTPPSGSLRTPDRGGTLTSGAVTFEGAALDSVGLAEVNLVIKDLETGQFLQEDGTWGSWSTVSATMGERGVGVRSWTRWTWSGTIDRDGQFQVWVQVIDTSGNRDPEKATRRFWIDTT